MKDKEIFISVDIESSGPIPGEYSLLSIGAWLAFRPKGIVLYRIKARQPKA